MNYCLIFIFLFIVHFLDNIPGRFRYDKESDEEEDDEDEFTIRNHKNSEDYDDSIGIKYNYYNPQTTDSDCTLKSPEVCNYHFNYQTYRAECSKLMANDAYDPNSIHDRQEPEGFDLRNFLREKAYKHQQESGSGGGSAAVSRLSQGSTATVLTKTNDDDDGDVVYEKPITQPIDIKKELNKLKGKNYFDYFKNNNRRKTYRMGSSRDNHNDYFDHRNSYSNDKYQYSNKKLTRSNSFNEEKNFKNDREHKEDLDHSHDEEESSDEDSTANCKKLRSVVAVISNKFVIFLLSM